MVDIIKDNIVYKLIIADKYKLYLFEKLLGEFNDITEVAEAAFDFIRTKELIIALKFMSDTNHNVAEFGGKGYFTVSYYDEKYEE